MHYRTLGSTGLQVSVLGFGASPLGDVFRITDPAEGKRAVHLAIDRGISLFDVSPYYGHTLAEERLGEALLGRRDKVVLATKCGRYEHASFDFSGKRIRLSIDESLGRLRTDHVDLLQAHDVEFGDYRQIVEETIPALRKIQKAGKARFIGITSYQLELMTRIAVAAPVDTFLSYCRYNLLIDDMDALLTPFSRERGIGLINASPLHMGIISRRGAPDWHPAPESVREAGRSIVAFCERRGLDASSLALQFALAHSYAASTLVGMSSTKHVQDGVDALEAEVDPAVFEEIRRLIRPVHNVVWPSGSPENADYQAVEIAK